MLLLIPVVMLAIVVLAWAGRAPSAAGEAVAAANSAARAASLAANEAHAEAAAQQAATAAVSAMCQTLTISVDTTRWDQGWVSVEATCQPLTSGLEALGTIEPIVRTSVQQLQQWGTRG